MRLSTLLLAEAGVAIGKEAGFDEAKHPRDEHGKFAEAGGGVAEARGADSRGHTLFGGTPAGFKPEDAARFRELKGEWARINNDILPHLDRPDSPEAQKAMDQLRDVVKEMHTLQADPGGVAGIGKPGGPRDLVVVGAGPGGLEAAITGGTDGLDTLLVESQPTVGGQSKYSSRIENYPGFPAGVSGARLAQNSFDQATRLGAESKLGVRVTGLSYDPNTHLKTVTLSNGETIQSRAVILAGGLEFNKLNFPGADSKSVTYGDGKTMSEMGKGAPVVVAGGSNAAAQAALGAAQTSTHVTVISRSPLEKGMSDYQVQAVRHNPKITVIEGDEIGKLSGDVLTTKGGKEIPAKSLGVFVGSSPKTDWLPKEIQRSDSPGLDKGKIIVDSELETGMPGVFAIGDQRVGSIGRILGAAADGQRAGKSIFNYYDRLQRAAGTSSYTKVDKADKARPVSNAEYNARIDQLWALDKEYPFFGQSYDPDTGHATFAIAKDYSEDLHPRDDHGRWSSGGNGSASASATATAARPARSMFPAFQMYSPNEAENLNFEQAYKNLSSPDQQRFVEIGRDIDRQVGLDAQPMNAVGDWSDGAENSVFNVIQNAPNFEAVEYSAAVKGDIANQKAVIPFLVDKNGGDSVYRFHLDQDIRDARGTLDQAGIQFRTLIPAAKGVDVAVYDPGSALGDKIGALAEQHDLTIEQQRGRGEFLGGDTREDGHNAYARVIQAWEGTHSRYYRPKPGDGVSVSRSQKAEEIGKGGEGSGVRGHTTPQPESAPRPPGVGPAPPLSGKALAAQRAYVSANYEEQKIADEQERILSQALGLPRTPDNDTFDLLPKSEHVAVEVKTMIKQKNDKITMDKAALARKGDFIAQHLAANPAFRAYTVVADKRGGPTRYYVRQGVGSFRLNTMQQVNVGQLNEIIHGT
jgi:thioredoxin reductase